MPIIFAKVFPLIKETFYGWYVKPNFSENLAVKQKIEAEDAHFLRKEFTLHYSIIELNVPNYI